MENHGEENPGGNQGEHSNKLTKYSKAYWVHHYIYNYILCSTQCVASWVDIFRKNKTLIPGNFLPDLSMCVDLIKAAAWLRLTTRFPFVVVMRRAGIFRVRARVGLEKVGFGLKSGSGLH